MTIFSLQLLGGLNLKGAINNLMMLSKHTHLFSIQIYCKRHCKLLTLLLPFCPEDEFLH